MVTETSMTGVILDQGSIGLDIDYSLLYKSLPTWEAFSYTDNEAIADRIKSSTVVVTNKVCLDRAVLEQAESLKLLCVAATGANNIDLNAACDLNIKVANVAGYATPSVVEHTFLLMLSLMRNINAYQNDIFQGAWAASKHFCLLGHPISELAGKKLGIVGYGELGQAVAVVARAFGMDVLVAKSLRQPAISESFPRLALDELLAEVDVLSLHCPLTDQTRGLINQQKMTLMKKSAIIINTARGGIVDEHALYQALSKGTIAGAGLDVLVEEPPSLACDLLRPSVPNLIVTPHIAWASQESRQRLVNEVALNIQAFIQNDSRNLINC